MPPDTCKLDVLFLREKDVWVGHCLQHDIAAQGETLRECMRAFSAVLVGRILVADELKIDDPFRDIPPAPAKYWKHYRSAFRLSPDESAFQFPAAKI